MGGFGYDQAIVDRFSGVRGGVIHATGLRNDPSSSALRALYVSEQRRVREEIGETPLSELPSLAAWRRAFTVFGVKPTQYRSAAESLLRRLTKQGDIPSISTLVDLANLVSIRHRLPVAVFDQTAVSGVTTVRFAGGDETFTDLGGDGDSQPDVGEVIFVDDAARVSARRWCWRQSAQSAAGGSTTDALITIEGQHNGAEVDVGRATDDMIALLFDHQPHAAVSTAALSPAEPWFEFGSS